LRIASLETLMQDRKLRWWYVLNFYVLQPCFPPRLQDIEIQNIPPPKLRARKPNQGKESILSQRFLPFCSLILALLISSPVIGKSPETPILEPFAVRSQNPLYLQFLSMPLEGPATLPKKHFESEVRTTFSNIFEYQPLGQETIFIDMELWQTVFVWKYGLGENLDLRLEQPLVSQFGGFLDGFIEGYHTAFGFPNGGREQEAKNRFRFSVGKSGTTLVDYNQQKLGFADTTLRIKQQLLKNNSPFDLAVAAFLKLPTGEAEAGLGSGHADFGASLFLQKDFSRLSLHSQVGGVFLGGHSLLDDHLRGGFFQFAQDLVFGLTNNFALSAQLSGNTPAFKNFSINQISEMVLDLSFGISGKKALTKTFANEFFYSVSFAEDVLSRGPSVDFSLLFQMGIRY